MSYNLVISFISGEDKQFVEMEERPTLSGMYRGNMTLFVSRIQRAIDEVKKLDGVDTDNIALIGFCFGGTGVMHYSFSENKDVKVSSLTVCWLLP